MTDPTASFKIVVVGAGPAGLAAACRAAEAGCRVGLVDDTPWLGGQIWRGKSPPPPAREWVDRFRRSGATLLDRTSVIAAPEPGLLLAERDEAPCRIAYAKLVLATGARELFLPFPGWTLPGVMGPGGMQSLVKNGWPIRDQRVVIAGSGPLLLAVADGLKKYGARIVSISEQAPLGRVAKFGIGLIAHPDKIFQALGIKRRLIGVPFRCGVWPVRADGGDRVLSVTVTDGQKTWTEECELFACGFGLVPNVELPLALGCKLKDGFVEVDMWRATSVKNVYCAGEPTGIGGVDRALVEGQIAGLAAAGMIEKTTELLELANGWNLFQVSLAKAFALRDELKTLANDDTMVCRCEDVSFGRLQCFDGWRGAKLQSRAGMGPCQGRVCGAAAKVIFGWGMESVRPPVLPAQVRSLISKP